MVEVPFSSIAISPHHTTCKLGISNKYDCRYEALFQIDAKALLLTDRGRWLQTEKSAVRSAEVRDGVL